jgi:uncharacterized DUF497 family protein
MRSLDDYSDNEFEWGLAKAALNWKDHRVTFEHAEMVFQDRFAVEYIDDREDYGEERINRVRDVRGQIVLRYLYGARGQASINFGQRGRKR